MLLALLLGGCATSDPYSLDGKDGVATVQGTSSLEQLIPLLDSGVTIEAVDSQPLKMTESQVILPAGPHSFLVSCHIDGQLGEHYTGLQEIGLDLVAGHTYKFVTEDPSAGSKAENNLALLHMLKGSGPGENEKALIAAGKGCESFAYDRSYDRHAYPDVVTLVPPRDPEDWKEERSGQRAGYQWRKLYDSNVGEQDAKDSVETEYWSRLMFADDAHARYQERLTKIQKDCPGATLSVLADTPAGLDYELDHAGCQDQPAVELGRFLGDARGLHRIAVLFKAMPSAAERDGWRKALDAATIQTL